MKKYDCYHGTGFKNYQNIVNSGTFTFKPRKNHWLGGGVYFFIEDKSRAIWWAKCNRPDKETRAVVLKLEIEFDNNELLNLDLDKDVDIVDEFAIEFRAALVSNKVQIRNIDKHEWNCKVLEAFLEKNPCYSAVCRTFPTTQRKGASGFQRLAKQLCVRDMDKLPIDKIEKIEVG